MPAHPLLLAALLLVVGAPLTAASATQASTKPYADAQLLSAECAGRTIPFHLQLPRGPIADDAPIFLLFHEAGGDEKTSLIWLNEATPAIVAMRAAMDARGWAYVVPYYYDWWQGSDAASVAKNEASYAALIEHVRGLMRERGAKAERNPVYLAGASFGGNRVLHLARKSPERYAGLALVYAAIQAYPQHGYDDTALIPTDWSRLAMPIHLWVSFGEGSIGPAMMRLYHLLTRHPGTTVTFRMDGRGGHDPRAYDPEAMLATLTGGRTGAHVIEQWNGSGFARIVPAAAGDPADEPVAWYPQQAYRAAEPFGSVGRILVKDPLLVAGSPRQAASGRRRVLVLAEEAHAAHLAYGTAYGSKDWTDGLRYASDYGSLARTASALGWQWVAPTGIAVDRIMSEVAARCPGFAEGTYALATGGGAQRLAALVSAADPAALQGVMLCDPMLDDAGADALLGRLPPAAPLVLGAPAAVDDPVGIAARRLYERAKAQGRPVLLVEKHPRAGATSWPILMHEGPRDFGFLRQAAPGEFRRLVATYVEPGKPASTRWRTEVVEQSAPPADR